MAIEYAKSGWRHLLAHALNKLGFDDGKFDGKREGGLSASRSMVLCGGGVILLSTAHVPTYFILLDCVV